MWLLPTPLLRNGVVIHFSLVLARISGQPAQRTAAFPCPAGWVVAGNDCTTQVDRSPGSVGGNVSVFGLQQNLLFSVTVAAATDAGLGPASEAANASTFDDAPTAAVTSLTVDAPVPAALRVVWLPPPLSEYNGVLTHYRVIITRYALGAVHMLTVTVILAPRMTPASLMCLSISF